MVGVNLKADTMKLMDRRSFLEAEMNAIIERLSQPGGPGLSGNLLGSEGFPRTDIDIPAVRAERRRLAELKNDHKEVTESINANIQVLHSVSLPPISSTPKVSDNGGVADMDTFTPPYLHDVVPPTFDDIDAFSSIPLALIDEISEASPAAEDGLQLGDQILKIGDVKAGDNLLERLLSQVEANEGRAIPVMLMRQGTPVNLMITPRAWRGRGLLGCHLRTVDYVTFQTYQQDMFQTHQQMQT